MLTLLFRPCAQLRPDLRADARHRRHGHGQRALDHVPRRLHPVRPALSSSPRRPCTLGPAHDARAHPHTALPVLVDQHEHLDQHVRPHDGRRVVPRECVLLSLPVPPRPGPTADGPPSLRATVNDCGKWLNNVGNGERFEGTYYIPGNTTAPSDLFPRVGDCAPWRVSCSFSFSSSSSSRASRRLHRRRRRRALLLTRALVDRRAGLPHLEPDDQGRPSPRRRDAHGRSSCASHLLSLFLTPSSSLVAGADVVRLLARSTGSSGRGRRATRRRSA